MNHHGSIPEESGLRLYDTDEEEHYILDLGSGVAQSACPTPQPSQIRRPIPRRPTRTRPQKDKEAERECGICFELAVAPVRTLCCAHLFCAEHISSWLHGPASDGRCPACRAPAASTGLLALGHPSTALLHLVPRAPPPSRSPSPSLSSSSSSSFSSASASSSKSYASYPSLPAPAAVSDPLSSDDSEQEDATDYSLPALIHARALQTRRHVPHPFLSSVLGLRAGLGRVVRVVGWVVVVAVLAGRGRWAAAD